jgi:hypothetical protein
VNTVLRIGVRLLFALAIFGSALYIALAWRRRRYWAMSRRRPPVFGTICRLLRDLVTLVRVGLTSRAQLAAENLFLRKQLALYHERRTKPRRLDTATQVALVLLGWRSILTVV